MGDAYRRNFGRGWFPSADSVGAPQDALLRADNLILDEEGVISLRLGSSKINASPIADLDIHTLFTIFRSGTKQRYYGAGNRIYIDGVAPTPDFAFDGSGDLSFGSWLSHVFAGRGTVKKKHNGTDLTNWGMDPPTKMPRVQAAANPYTVSIATCNSAESPAFTANEGTITATFPTGADGTANGAIEVTPASGTGRATITKTFASDQNFFDIQGFPGDDQDVFDMMVWISEPEKIEFVTVMLGLGTGSDAFQDDYYFFDFKLGGPRQSIIDVSGRAAVENKVTRQLREIRSVASAPGRPIRSVLPQEVIDSIEERREDRRRERKDKASNPGWTHLSSARGSWNRIGATSGRDWRTIRSIKLVYKAQGGATGAVRYDSIIFIGGMGYRSFDGNYRIKYRWRKDYDEFQELSGPSDKSAEIRLNTQPLQVIIPSEARAAKDPQADKIDIFMFGGLLPDYYKVATASTTAWDSAGSQLDDLIWKQSTQSMSYLTQMATDGFPIPAAPPAPTDDLTIDIYGNEIDALIENEVLDIDSRRPPDNMVGPYGVAGPYFDRMFCLTQANDGQGLLYASKRRAPGLFSESHVFKTGDRVEKPYWTVATTGGLYVGTSKDVYVLTGDGAELEDGTLDFTLRPLNVGDPPADSCIAVEGNGIIYRALRNWWVLTGDSVAPLKMEDVELLHQGYTRHGVSPLNVDDGRFRAIVSSGILTFIAPEGASTTSSDKLYRLHMRKDRWYRHDYPTNWRYIFQEPDGVILASDNNGTVWILDAGSQDEGTDIPVVIWTPVDANGLPYVRKDPLDLQIKLDTNGNNLAVAVHHDGSGSAATPTPINFQGNGLTIYKTGIQSMSAFRMMQYRMTGSFSTFKLYETNLTYRARPQHRMAVDTGYVRIGEEDVTWVREIRLMANSPVNLTLQVYLDGVIAATKTVTVTANVPRPYSVMLGREVAGYQLRVLIETTNNAGTGEQGFEVYWVDYRPAISGTKSAKRFKRVWPERVAKSDFKGTGE